MEEIKRCAAKSRESENITGISSSIKAGVSALYRESGPINEKTNIDMKALRPRTFDANTMKSTRRKINL